MMSSVIPSAKYSCSGSPDMLTNGSTAMDGLSGSGSDLGVSDALTDRTENAWTGAAMFFHTGLATRINKEGVLRVVSQRYRTR